MADDIQPNFFTKAFNNFVNKLPYSAGTQTAKELNPKFDTFHQVSSSQKDKYIDKLYLLQINQVYRL